MSHIQVTGSCWTHNMKDVSDAIPNVSCALEFIFQSLIMKNMSACKQLSNNRCTEVGCEKYFLQVNVRMVGYLTVHVFFCCVDDE